MGKKLELSQNDPFLDSINKSFGISGGCYCCGQQLHVLYDDTYALPTAKIQGDDYNVLICDGCENDFNYLGKELDKKISYDTLFYIQEDLSKDLFKLSKKNNNFSENERFKILKNIYIKYDSDKKLKR